MADEDEQKPIESKFLASPIEDAKRYAQALVLIIKDQQRRIEHAEQEIERLRGAGIVSQ